jgi:hypothetical protein
VTDTVCVNESQGRTEQPLTASEEWYPNHCSTQLINDCERLQLPTDYSRKANQTFRHATEPLAMPIGLSVAVEALSRQAGVIPFVTLLAALDVLLYRYSGQEKITLGVIGASHGSQEQGFLF